MNYAIAAAGGFVAGLAAAGLFLGRAVAEVKTLVAEAHSKIDVLIAAAKTKI